MHVERRLGAVPTWLGNTIPPLEDFQTAGRPRLLSCNKGSAP